jgi:hypothetical protein
LRACPGGFVFGTDGFDAETSPPGGPPPPGAHIERPENWIDPPDADGVRMLLELARGFASTWRDLPHVEEQVRSYIDLALSVLHGPLDPAVIQPRIQSEIDELESTLTRAVESTRGLRRRFVNKGSAVD